jgi:hypothetical protein
MATTRLYVNAIVVDTPDGEVVQPIGEPTARLDLVEKRVQRNPRHRFGITQHYDDVVIAYRDVQPWAVLEGKM